MADVIEGLVVVEPPADGRRVRCYATSKRTGAQCGRLVRAQGHLCKWHGGKNPVVAARQEMEAALSKGYRPPTAPVDPLSSIEDMLGLTQQVVAQLRVVADQAGMATTEQMTLLGAWMDRLLRFAQTVQMLAGVKAQLDEGQVQILIGFVEDLVLALGHDTQDPHVRDIIRRQLELVEERGDVAVTIT